MQPLVRNRTLFLVLHGICALFSRRSRRCEEKMFFIGYTYITEHLKRLTILSTKIQLYTILRVQCDIHTHRWYAKMYQQMYRQRDRKIGLHHRQQYAKKP